MPGIERLFDINTGGGVIVSIPQGSVFANGRLVSVRGSFVTPHPPCPIVPIHCAAITLCSSSSVYAGGIPVNRITDCDSCGHSRLTGSSNVFAG